MAARKKKPKTTRDSWGSISYDPKTMVARVRYWAETDKGYRRCSKTFRNVTRKEAEEKRAQLMLEHGKDKPCPTMGQVYEKWYLPDRQRMFESGDISVKTLQTDESTWSIHLKDQWSDVPCDQIRPLDVQMWITGSLTGGAANRVIGLARRIIDYAVRFEFVTTNQFAVKYVLPSRKAVARTDDYAWSIDELGDLWRDHAYGKFWEGAFICSAFGSARVGESLAVLADDVWTCERNGVFVAVAPIRSQVSNTTYRIESNLKNGWSIRDIVVPGEAGRRLALLAEKNGGTYLTNNGVGGFIQQRRMRTAWDAELGPDAHPFKNLRKSWETFTKWYLKVPSNMVERMMGHVGKGVTSHHYDRPEVEQFIDVITEHYAERPYADGWDWLKEPEKDVTNA